MDVRRKIYNKNGRVKIIMEKEMRNYLPSGGSGRNFPCYCGSGKKYKKCCLNKDSFVSKKETLKQFSMEKLRDGNSGGGAICGNFEKMGIAKMSAVILEYADELLEMTQTPCEKQKAMGLAIIAWNLSLLKGENQKNEIDAYLLDIMKLKKNSEEWNDMLGIMQALIEKRMEYYSEYDRFIFDYEFIHLGPGEFHLNVVSSLS